jgi:transposase
MSDVFAVSGRVRRGDQRRLMPIDERQTIDACMRQIDFLQAEIDVLDKEIAQDVITNLDIRQLMTLPGVSGVTGTALMTASGDINRFPSADHLVGYLGARPPRSSVRQRAS